jgi:ABC-2 type transport system permease protein
MSELTMTMPAPAAVRAPVPARPGVAARRGFGTEWTVLIGRCLRLSRRNVDAAVTALMLPIMLMLVFVYLFGGAIDTGTAYVTYVVPGVLLLCAGFGAVGTAVTVSQDMTGGIVDRFRSLDVRGATMLGGHVVASVARNAVSTLLVLGIAVVIGFRPHATVLGALGAAGILVLFITALSWLSAVAGLVARSAEAASGYTFVPMFLPYASSAFVPIATMPGWLHGFARNQPFTPVIDTLRGLLLGTGTGGQWWHALAWCLGLLAVGVALSGVLFRRRTAG